MPVWFTPVAAVRDRRSSPPSVTRGRWVFALTLLLALGPALHAAVSAEPARLAAKSLLLDIARTDDQLVAVGDRGHVVRSSDGGLTWTQSPTPTRSMLTGVSFPDARHGCAVGHDGVILATQDGGSTWTRQDDGKDTATVWLDVLFRDPLHGFVVGAYGKFAVTTDGGKTWTAVKPADDEVHFNRISAGSDGHLYLAGESGTVLVSRDGGKEWNRVEAPYDGSFFGVLPLEGARIIAYGLRGHILRSDDHGASWEPLNSDVRVLIMGGTRLRQDALVLAGQGGNFFLSRDAGLSFTHWKSPDFGTSVADLVEAPDGAIVTVGEAGAVRLELPKP
jgi:photosystem II stability/assembly factor-like uncharacterized protein